MQATDECQLALEKLTHCSSNCWQPGPPADGGVLIPDECEAILVGPRAETGMLRLPGPA